MTKEEIYRNAIKIYGEVGQENQAIEELSELILAISHKHRGRRHNIPEEIADCEIMLEQLKLINGCEQEVSEIRKRKIERLFDLVFDECL